MIIDPAKATLADIHRLLVGGIVPRPIALVSTVSAEGRVNLAPFSFFNAVSSEPPAVMIAPGLRSSDGERKDTLNNIEATGEFVVNIVTVDMGAAMVETATEFPPETNEFDVAGFTSAASEVVAPPRVSESPINMECTLFRIVPIGERANVVIGEVVRFHIDDDVYENGRINIEKLRPLGRLAGSLYASLGPIISHKRKPFLPDS